MTQRSVVRARSAPVQAQLPKLLGLFLVVCFGSCMDVAGTRAALL